MLSGPPPPRSCLFSAAFVQVIMKRVREARNMPFHQDSPKAEAVTSTMAQSEHSRAVLFLVVL